VDPDPFGSSGSGSLLGMRIRIQEHENLTKIYKLTWFPAFQKGFCTFVGMLLYLLPTLSILSCKNSAFSTFKPDHDPDPDWFGSLDPDPY
jgi:hypothetical protein